MWWFLRVCLSTDFGHYGPWEKLLASVQTGEKVFDKVHGCFWQFLQQRPQQWAIFNEAMRTVSAGATPAVTGSYDWSRFPLIADVGGGIGTQLVDILNTNPSCHGILFDQPGVIPQASPHERIKCVGGNFFENVPSGADACILRWIVHDWGTPEAIEILKTVGRAMKPRACLLVLEQIIPETPEYTFENGRIC